MDPPLSAPAFTGARQTLRDLRWLHQQTTTQIARIARLSTDMRAKYATISAMTQVTLPYTQRPRHQAWLPSADWVRLAHRGAIVALSVATFMLLPGAISNATTSAPVAGQEQQLVLQLQDLQTTTDTVSQRALANGRSNELLSVVRDIQDHAAADGAALTAIVEGWKLNPNQEFATPDGAITPEQVASLRNLYGQEFDQQYCDLMIDHQNAVASAAQKVLDRHGDGSSSTLATNIKDKAQADATRLVRTCNSLGY